MNNDEKWWFSIANSEELPEGTVWKWSHVDSSKYPLDQGNNLAENTIIRGKTRGFPVDFPFPFHAVIISGQRKLFLAWEIGSPACSWLNAPMVAIFLSRNIF